MRYINAENLRVVAKCIRMPRTAFWILKDRFSPPVDRVYSSQIEWNTGLLPRLPLGEVLPNATAVDIQLLRAIDRQWMTSISLDELCCLVLIAKTIGAKRVLEIGTWDGNTILNLAANTGAKVTTVDLPPEFDAKTDRASLRYPDVRVNVTNRTHLGRQFRRHPLEANIRQIYGDSAQLDWASFDPPFDLIFIDGCHDYKYVKSDTRHARACLRPGGAIVWHDYGMIGNVSRPQRCKPGGGQAARSASR